MFALNQRVKSQSNTEEVVMSHRFNSINGSIITRLEILTFGAILSGMVLNLSLEVEQVHPSKLVKGIHPALGLLSTPMGLLMFAYGGLMGWLIYRAMRLRSPIFGGIVVGMFSLTMLAVGLMILF